MKADIHPEYRHVVFHDVSSGFQFLTKSCIKTDKTTEYEGQEYPVVNVDISSASHPFYTGDQKSARTAGRVERYFQKYGFTEEPEAEAKAEEAAAEEKEGE